jgi:hypothetical protein
MTDRQTLGRALGDRRSDNQVKSLSRKLTSTRFMTCKSQDGAAIAACLCRMKTDVQSRNEGSVVGNLNYTNPDSWPLDEVA